MMSCCKVGLSCPQVLKIVGVVFAGAAILGGQSACSVPLLNASASGDTKAVLNLLQKGHDVNEGFPLVGTRPLMLAAAYGHTETARVLLDAGADVNAKDLTGWTALHAGAFNGDASIVSLLLERGAVQGKPHWFLQSPGKIAEMLDHKDLVPLLGQIQAPTHVGVHGEEVLRPAAAGRQVWPAISPESAPVGRATGRADLPGERRIRAMKAGQPTRPGQRDQHERGQHQGSGWPSTWGSGGKRLGEVERRDGAGDDGEEAGQSDLPVPSRANASHTGKRQSREERRFTTNETAPSPRNTKHAHDARPSPGNRQGEAKKPASCWIGGDSLY